MVAMSAKPERPLQKSCKYLDSNQDSFISFGLVSLTNGTCFQGEDREKRNLRTLVYNRIT